MLGNDTWASGDCFDYCHFQTAVFVYLGMPIIVFGILGNLLTILVLSRDNYVTKTTGYLLQMLALADLLFLVTCIISQPLDTIIILRKWWPSCVKGFGNYVLPFMFPVSGLAEFAAVYMVVLVTVDRYIAICYPLHAPRLCTLPRMKKAVIAVWVASFLYNFPRFFEYQLEENPETGEWVFYQRLIGGMSGTVLRRNAIYNVFYLTIAFFIFRFLLPLVALVYLNVSLIRTIRRTARLHGDARLGRYTKTLIVIVVVFIMCQLPDFFRRIPHLILVLGNPNMAESRNYLHCIASILHTINSSINFLIYCFLGNKFRSILLTLLECRRVKRSSLQTNSNRTARV